MRRFYQDNNTTTTMTAPNDFPLPTIHSNGTSLRMLLDDYQAAHRALQDFIESYGKIEFNARDYYPQGPYAWDEAHDARLNNNNKIRHVKKYLEAHLTHLASHQQP
jgi:hypothetical protein